MCQPDGRDHALSTVLHCLTLSGSENDLAVAIVLHAWDGPVEPPSSYA